MIRVLATLAVITALAAAAAHFGYQELEKRLLAASCLPAPPAGPADLREDSAGPVSEPDALPAAQNFQIIISRDIFRSTAAKQENKRPEPEPAPPPVETVLPTTLNLTLAGTVLGSGQISRAIIINNTGRDRQQQLLQIGDGVPGAAAVIKEIDWESVTLEVNGREEILTMAKPKSAPGFRPQAMVMPPPRMPAPPSAGGAPGGRPVRLNRRISLPDTEAPAGPPDLPEDLLRQEEIPPPELPAEPEELQPELPPFDVE